MRPLRATSLVLAFLAATGLVLGSFAFSAMSADRGLDVGVSDDDVALVGYADISDDRIQSKEEAPIARYDNRFAGDLDEFNVSVTVIEGDATAEIPDPPDGIGFGDSTEVGVQLHCETEQEVTLELVAEGSGAGVNFSLTREVTVTCVPKEPQIVGVTFNDAANAQFDFETDDGPGAASAGGDGTAEAVVWQKPTPPKGESDATDLEAEWTEISPDDPNLRNVLAHGENDGSEHEDGENWKVIAIEFPNQDVAFFHPGWDAGTFDDVSTSDGVQVDLDDDLTAGDVIEKSFVDDEDDSETD